MALNQAPMGKPVGSSSALGGQPRRVWNRPHPTPAHLLRSVWAASFNDAVQRLSDQAISTPAIYSIAGDGAEDTAVIERSEKEARVHRGAQAAANLNGSAHGSNNQAMPEAATARAHDGRHCGGTRYELRAGCAIRSSIRVHA